MALLPVDEALGRLLDGLAALDAETVPIAAAGSRVLATPVEALRSQPPCDVSAMDGYAVRAADLDPLPERLSVIGEAAAGQGHAGAIAKGQAVRIFTGAPVPPGADTILIQENAVAGADGSIRPTEAVAQGRHIRRAGLDFATGDRVLEAGTVLDAAALSLAAAADHATLAVVRRPRIAVIMTGDELVAPGAQRRDDQIVASNGYGIAALAERDGAVVAGLEIVGDDPRRIGARLRAVRDRGADIIVTIGGASVGDHDHVHRVLSAEGVTLDFWKIAMRPGKPLMVGRWDGIAVIGLPGNPVSSLVCAHVFLRPLVARLAGRAYEAPLREARLAAAMPANGDRRDYVRARLSRDEDGTLLATPFEIQDSSMLRVLAASDALILREPGAPPASAGAPCRVLLTR